MSNNRGQAQIISSLVKKAWSDDNFKGRLLSDPHTVLKEAGISIPAGVTVKVHENTDKISHFVLPPKPSSNLSEDEINRIAVGCSPSTENPSCLYGNDK